MEIGHGGWDRSDDGVVHELAVVEGLALLVVQTHVHLSHGETGHGALLGVFFYELPIPVDGR